jgi:hypothetical protein
MKTLTIVLTALISLAIYAQSEKTIESAPANYLQALKSDNDGMVESTIFHSLKYKMYYPERNTAQLENQIENLVENGKTEAIRYKAFLANQFMQNSKLLNKIGKQNYKDEAEFFKMLGEELNNYFLVAK